MKEMLIQKLALRNFKGIKEFILQADGESLKVFGDNATGKTTLFDGFNWLLFDKDSHNKKDFQLKTVTVAGEEIHGQEHEVEGTFLVDGKETTLRKVFSEKWTKKRGSAERTFSGHTTDYYVNSVPVKKKEYTDKVAQIIDEDVFKLLTSPSFFNEQLHWQKRRDILLEVCGDITDEEVIQSDRKLIELPGILSGRSIEDHRKVIASKRAEINKELDRIPVRIDEVQRSIPEVEGLDEESIHDDLTYVKKAIEDKEEELNRIRSGGEVSEKQKQLREVEGDILQIKNEHQASNHDKVNAMRKELYQVKGQVDSVKYEIDRKKNQRQRNSELIADYEKRADQLRSEWHKVNEKEFEDSHEKDCPTCGQSLPEEQLKEAHEKAKANFNLQKAEALEGIVAQGKSLKAKSETLVAENDKLQDEALQKEKKLSELQEQITALDSEIKALEEKTSDITENSGYRTKVEQAKNIEKSIEALRSSVDESASKVKDQITNLKAEKDKLELDLSKFNQENLAQKRMQELADQEKKLAAEFEQLEQQLYLTEEFIRTKVNLLEEKINSKFQYAQFKLFDTQINDGLKETCETLYKGVPYSGGLNNAARINVGLDIINTLSEHYGFSAPIFVDNSEAVTRLIDTKAQVISLIVSEEDKALRVEQAERTAQEAI